jgi:hypothetical protein
MGNIVRGQGSIAGDIITVTRRVRQEKCALNAFVLVALRQSGAFRSLNAARFSGVPNKRDVYCKR